MSKNVKEERLRWVLPIVRKEVRLVDVARVCPFSQRSLERWVATFRKYGEAGLEPKSTRPKTNPRETPIWIKERIIELRKETKKCALKLKWDLEKEGIEIDHRTIGKIIKQEGLTRKYRTRKLNYKYERVPLKLGELIEIDVKYVPYRLNRQRFYQFTAIDVASRWRYLKVYDQQSSYHAILFLKEVIERFPLKIEAVKTDNHAIFTNRYVGYLKSSLPQNPRLHPLDIFCQRLNIEHYLIDPGKPQQNCFVERSHRSDQESFYDEVQCKSIDELEFRLRLWNMYYNNLAHCSLNGKSPNQMLEFKY